MVVDSDGYQALIEHFAFNLTVFEQPGEAIGDETIADIVHDLVASNIMTICEQNPGLSSALRFTILREADRVVEDMEEVLAGRWEQPVTAPRYFDVKNSDVKNRAESRDSAPL
ncbi:hypothetical protein BZG79_11875 [Salinivibrio sp. MA427]|uniref:DUF3802 family protein n=1 Tax=Salinivibrio sp. MA427 TaxID=1909455 RepID=UPI00098B28CA|nr:DUF3802 family protein [Salinivibrio sp. MA427]OOF08637.1 hypothetical protein BZG79_11875 [Salinivibrio sp. MA427]